MVEIGENIKKLRKAKRMTQKEVANQLNVTPQTISKWERNISYPDLDMLVRLSQLFHISTDALLGNTKPTFFASLFSKKKRGKTMEKVPATPSAIQTDKLSSSEKQIMIFSVSSWITEGELQTQRLQLKLQKYFTVQRQPIAVEMYSLSKVAEKAPAADLILLTPEAQFALKELQEAVPHTPILLLSSQEYGLLPIEQIAEKSLQAML
ncbi:helix-turn-helix domain-containing protein [Enterococcus gallinarum]|uniref:Helix-turn-helix transcriptional regulator n=1 Tax=Enterococcus gallinarum TaxID=1353 RepID=A0ABD4ZRE2_ENTGA|nr:helix-turn-helix transcriptional regulator [Enterococcus gallinarum]MBF0822431.1 helix-turn-helix domain-containing protein [Enterococcus faecalis]MBF0724844.1 helix-turn-helix domain-containing protein [Enterococcus gallinarum]MBF0796645.1 helix-turn-helix domain-containing protein [Enterococcus gallinarum]MBX8977520.1 helix-turn-helix domain-containing protein [Enterococcus gallinarum]MDL4874787.1 helix-turn-helix transcriptional regulator [Enterococcus gallinarum]